MVTSSKILTVTYGTFSCTLEGFDDPFTTLQKVAEYFRKLAAADRYFGGTPQTPDTETLRQIAEANSAGPINAEISDHGITLRQSADAPPVPFDVGQAEADQSVDVAEDATPDAVDTPEPVHFFRSRRAEHESDPEILAEVVIEPEVEVEPEAEAAVAPMPDPVAEVTPVEEAMPESELEGTPEPEPVSVATTEPETTSEPETASDDISRVVAGIAAAAETGAAIRAAAPARDVEQTLAAIRQNVQQAESEIAAADQSQAEATPETDAAEPEITTDAEPAEADAENVIAYSETEAEPDNLFVEETVAEPEMVEPDAAAPVEAEALDAEPPESEEAEAEPIMDEPADIAPVEAETAEADPYEVEIVEAEVEVAEAPASVEAELEAEIAETLIEAEAEDVAAETPAPTEAYAETPAEAAPEAETLEAPQQADIPAEEEEGVEAVAEAEPAPASTLSEEDEADLARQLAAAMDLDAGDDAETPDETQWRAERRRRASALREMAAPTNGNGALDRLLHTAQVQMDHPEQQRRVNALDQLKAAVAATEAEAEHRRKTPEKAGESEDATEMESFRRDFRQVQSRAGLARLSGGGEHRPASPLILVSEQRIDEPVSDDAPMREMAESHGNLALKPRMVSAPAAMDDGDDDEIQGIPSDAFSGAENFEDFVERVGVFEMTELLEAAAAYTSIVEREDRFSRASVMSKIAMLNHGEGYSKEAGLRAFGKLLREGKILRVQDGQFAISKASRYSVASRYES